MQASKPRTASRAWNLYPSLAYLKPWPSERLIYRMREHSHHSDYIGGVQINIDSPGDRGRNFSSSGGSEATL